MHIGFPTLVYRSELSAKISTNPDDAGLLTIFVGKPLAIFKFVVQSMSIPSQLGSVRLHVSPPGGLEVQL